MLHVADSKDTLAPFISQRVMIQKSNGIDHEEFGFVAKYRTVF